MRDARLIKYLLRVGRFQTNTRRERKIRAQEKTLGSRYRRAQWKNELRRLLAAMQDRRDDDDIP